MRDAMRRQQVLVGSRRLIANIDGAATSGMSPDGVKRVPLARALCVGVNVETLPELPGLFVEIQGLCRSL
eukprot:CAMPEP_0114470866 /NCGR_PEP_ID=MMETSP0104-20121206/11499_1 /TAXON_ID=37642 ORGANISM="Paraphysomonas imperforata, Strain PA2" /NCGR_SAMPLE_ID=MMETSP0104 /ASSEMBLY_ACC=CAM_ASM_000202 /LENGTH=69 /DNA_ID=CAMNT_0001644657 /DNA_START=1437 /DNA_END=1642 /DNA_ORIENTATION=+